MLDSIFSGLRGDLDLDDTIDTFMAKLDLKGQECGLKHVPNGYDIEQPPAVEYLCQNLGYSETGEVTEVLRVPICQECVEGLLDPNWALLYCVTCHNSQWVYKPKSSYEFHTSVVWLNECPHCAENVEEKEV